jgi:predicted nucleic acid-binding protein
LTFFDTNVLIAASIAHHPHHEACSKRLAQIRRSGASCAAHTLAETYSTLTREGKGYSVPPLIALQILSSVKENFDLVSLTANEMMQTISSAAERALPGPLIYDALILACARKIQARSIYTNDVQDFKRIAPDLASRIHEP